MANAALSLNNDSLSGEENDDVISVKSGRSNSTSSKSKRRTPRASQADFDNLRRNVSELGKRFSNVDSKLDRLMNLMDFACLARQRPQSTGMDTAVFHTVTGTMVTLLEIASLSSGMRMTRYPYNQVSERSLSFWVIMNLTIAIHIH
ncbi:hypothetical protein DPMN_140443 [Dreissena polymorpha]|uniref:Uncharacterized protein n=1 Tax=Dreissena polymorpha TaxID=45954 RepID=A0A9D4G852_DREPO|nr:hypothetical protein DPMN_140443 [Dreissena polymorpha]